MPRATHCFRNEETFVVASEFYRNKLQEMNDSLHSFRADIFFGYCFQDGLCHYKLQVPDVGALLDSYDENCGVFAAVKQSSMSTVIFSDSLGQYPIFYYHEGDDFVVSNNFWIVTQLCSDGTINTECAYDYVTYESPLLGETLAPSIYRMRTFETIEISDRFRLIQSACPEFDNKPYEVLLQEAATRMKERVAAVLAVGAPVVHLSGGVDSRLAFSSFAACGYTGPVFSFGDGDSQDRLVHERLVEEFGLSQGVIKWFKDGESGADFMKAILAFNAMKSNSLSNWGEGFDPEYMEVTGFFSEGLLKGFGKYRNSTGALAPFRSAKEKSCFGDPVFDHTASRMQVDFDHIESLLGRRRFSLFRRSPRKRLVNALFYLYNRAASHFGMHSAVSNRKFRSIDIIYDPKLLGLMNRCKHTDKQVKQGSICIDLIRKLHSDKLAFLPYDRRVIQPYDRITKDVRNSGEITCFVEAKFAPRNLARVQPEIHRADDAQLARFAKLSLTHNGPKEMYRNDIFRKLFDDLPELRAAIDGEHSGQREVEKEALSTLAIAYWLLADKHFFEMDLLA
jgi:hypothetical protein